MAYTKYSLTPANNTATPPDGAPEGMLPSAVNDTMRDMMAQIRDCGDGIRDGTYTMTAPKITGGTITGAAFTGNTFTSPVISGGSINNTPIGATTANTGRFSDLTDTGLTSGRVIYASTGGNLVDDADFTFNGTTVTMANDASISGLTVGKGVGSGNAGNTALGFGVLGANTTGASNTGAGYLALNSNTTGANNIAFGGVALTVNTTGNANTAIGNQALISNTTASNNTAVGYQAGYSNTTGNRLTIAGNQAGVSNTTGSYNSFYGYFSGYSNSTGSGNTFLGDYSGFSNTTSGNNTYVGQGAGQSTTGNTNAFFGQGSGTSVTTGSKNTIIGSYNGNAGGLNITTASNYIVLSDGDGNPRCYWNAAQMIMVGNAAVFGRSSYSDTENSLSLNSGRILSTKADDWNIELAGAQTNRIRFYTSAGGRSTTVGSITVNTTNTAYNTSSDYRLKHDIQPMVGALDRVAKLKPVTYKWNLDNSEGEGFIAHELAEVCPQAVTGEKDALDKDGNILAQGIDTSHMVGLLTAAIQELKAEVDSLKAQLNK